MRDSMGGAFSSSRTVRRAFGGVAAPVLKVNLEGWDEFTDSAHIATQIPEQLSGGW